MSTALQSSTDAQALKQSSTFGVLLRQWRGQRKQSQLTLSVLSGVSQRHISFLESGRAQPSRAMVLQLGEALQCSLRDRNALLSAAGFAPVFSAKPLDDESMSLVRQGLELSLNHHEPYPAMVVDGSWQLLMHNEAAKRFLSLLGEPDSLWPSVNSSVDEPNIMRLTFHPNGLQPFIRNWDEAAQHMLWRLRRETQDDPANAQLSALYREVRAYEGVPELDSPGQQTPGLPLLALEIDVGSQILRVFTLISRFGTAQDITAEDLRIETFLPADEATAAFFKSLSEAQAAE